jgi:hypothetical protein
MKSITACVTFKVVVGYEVADPANLTEDEVEVITTAALDSMTDKWEADDLEVIEIRED